MAFLVGNLFNSAFLDFGQWKGGRGDWKQNREGERRREEKYEKKNARENGREWLRVK